MGSNLRRSSLVEGVRHNQVIEITKRMEDLGRALPSQCKKKHRRHLAYALESNEDSGIGLPPMA